MRKVELMLDLFDSDALRNRLSVAGVVGLETVLTAVPIRDLRVIVEKKLGSEDTETSELATLAGVEAGMDGGGMRVAEGDGESFLESRCIMVTFDAWEGASISGEQMKEMGRRI